MNGLIFRCYSPRDRGDCEAALASNIPDSFDERSRRGFVHQLRTSPDSYFVVELASGAVVACGGCRIDGWGIAWFDWGFVAKTHQGRGIGSFLLKSRIELAERHLHCWCILLETKNPTRGFFERHGFEAISSDRNADGYIPMRMILKVGSSGNQQAAGKVGGVKNLPKSRDA